MKKECLTESSWLLLRNLKDRLSFVKYYYITSLNFPSFIFMSSSS